MELSKNFIHREAEKKWYLHWEKSGYFSSQPDNRPAYTIVMPPPNVTGVLHMGHALNNSVQDILIRRAKMMGYNTCWVPGTDHASIATEAKVVGMLREMGIDKKKMPREEFLKYAWEWKEKYGGIILKQLEELGCALDWNRTNFTMDDHYYKAVIRVFVELYNKGCIYRGVKMINWDPKAKTALSDEEVIHKETNSKLVYIRYRLDIPNEEYITIATVRPETILGDTAVCVHPEDSRYAHLKGKYCFVPLINRRVPIIFDEYIDKEFGTGALKVTPAHDINDYNLGLKHKLPVVDTLNEDGTMSNEAQLYIGEDRFAVRKKIIEELRQKGHLVKEEDYINNVGFSERTNEVIEPRLSMQWWCNMQEMAKPALAAVVNNDIEFHPAKFKNLYMHWMDTIKDWCISRQLWWGQRIPAWYDADNTIYVAQNEEEAYLELKKQRPELDFTTPNLLRQEEDVLDTWFSSWLWPLEVFNWNETPDNEELKYYYPTNTLVTAPEIIFFWVARMIMAGYEFKGQKPFDKVYFTGIVRDKMGRKMSKSLGNSPDLLKLIEDFGADAVRFSVMISSPAGNDLLYDENQLEQGRNFCNKLWNAMKLVKSWETRCDDSLEVINEKFSIAWMEARLAEVAIEVDGLIKDFRLSEGLKTIYSLIWNDFCSWYLEWVKPAMDAPIATIVWQKTVTVFEQLLQLLHPYMPFVTEEIYHQIKERQAGDDLMIKQIPPYLLQDNKILNEGAFLKELITATRDIRVKNQLKPKDTIKLYYTGDTHFYNAVGAIFSKQINAETLDYTAEAKKDCISYVVQQDSLYIEAVTGTIDFEAQRKQMEKDLAYLQGFLLSVEKKLSNERFVQNAKPEILEIERKKMADAKAKISTIEQSIKNLN